MFGARRGTFRLSQQVGSFISTAALAGTLVAANVTLESWILIPIFVLTLVLGWVCFREIWSRHADGKDAYRVIMRVELWLLGIASCAGLLLWLRLTRT